jgi:hypothetical protein
MVPARWRVVYRPKAKFEATLNIENSSAVGTMSPCGVAVARSRGPTSRAAAKYGAKKNSAPSIAARSTTGTFRNSWKNRMDTPGSWLPDIAHEPGGYCC